MTPIAIVINKGVTVQQCYSVSYKSTNDITALMSYADKIAVVFIKKSAEYYVLDFKKLLIANPGLNFASWSELDEFINARDTAYLDLYVTTVVVPQYMHVDDTRSVLCPFGSFVKNQLNIVSFENGNYGDVELADSNDPYVRDSRRSFSNNKDVLFTNTKNVDLRNSIPIVCGCACRPLVWTNIETRKLEMFAAQAGRLITYAKWNQKYTRTAPHYAIPSSNNTPVAHDYKGKEPPVPRTYCYNVGIMMIDFSPIGTIDVINYDECTDYRVEKIASNRVFFPRTNLTLGANYHIDPNDWKRGDIDIHDKTEYVLSFILPKRQTSGVPIVSICGRLFLYNENMAVRHTSDGIQIVLRIGKDLFERIVLSNMQHYGKHIDETTTVQTMLDIVINNLFNKEAVGYGSLSDISRTMYSDFLKPFVIMVHTDKQMHITRTQPKMTLNPDKIVFPRGAGGLLFNKNTWEIIDYVRVNYTHDTLVLYPLQCPLNMVLDTDMFRTKHPQLGYERYECTNEKKYLKMSEYTKSLRDPDAFELIDISYTDR